MSLNVDSKAHYALFNTQVNEVLEDTLIQINASADCGKLQVLIDRKPLTRLVGDSQSNITHIYE